MYRLLLLLVFLGTTTFLFAQAPPPDSLIPADRQVLFQEELAELMTGGKPEPVETAYQAFMDVFLSGHFSEAERQRIVDLGLLMREHRLGASPHFQSFLNALVKVKQTTDGPARFQEWTKVLETLLHDDANMSANDVGAFLQFSQDFFTYNAVRYSPNSTSWFVFTEDIDWRYDGRPVLDMDKARLVANRLDDTLVIEQAKVVYYPIEFQLEGYQGRTSWERTELGPDVYVDMQRFTIDTKRSLYEAPVAFLRYPLYFGEVKIKGHFEDKLVSDNSRTSYPRFESEEEFLNFANVGEGIRLRGGFRLHGNTVYAFGSGAREAEVLLLNQRNQPRFRSTSELWTVRNQERLVGSNCHAVVYIGADTLFHPSVNVRIDIPEQVVQLTRGQRGSDRNPFFHSLHQMNIQADYITAYLQEDSLVIGRPTVSFANKDDVIFESLDFFSQSEYDQIQSIATANPLAIMAATARHEGVNTMSAELLAQRINSRFSVESIQPLLYDLVGKGFINYDADRQIIELKDKVFHYVDANQDRGDYDFFRIVSKTDTANATIDLNTGYTLLSGVRRVDFSNAQRVAARPAGQQLYIKGDRNFDFDGRLFAGFSTLEGKDYHFEYQPYQIKLDSVRFFDLFVPTGQVDDQSNPVALSIGSRIEHLTGTLLVDAPNNKAGIEDIFMFPSLQSEGYSYVYYDRDSTQAGAYGRDSFYFRLEPFSFDHLDRFGPQDLQFKGTMFSAGIFPDFDETLMLQDSDQSLGFTRPTPDEGFGTYGDKGTFAGDINLSNQGLLGQGRLRYLTANIDAEDFVFKPNQTLASAERFDLEEDRDSEVPVPQVRGEDVTIDWRPYQDSLLVRSTEDTPFQLFSSDEHSLDGLLVLTPDGLKGDGLLDWPAANARSRIFSFDPFAARADTMSLKIKALEGDNRIALETNNVNGELDFDAEEGRFHANDEYLVTTLPYNQYITSMNEFNWDMNGNQITFLTEEGRPGLFTSIHPDQDSLQFSGEEATYDLATSLLQIHGVPYIHTADAFVYPDSQYVEIAPNAEMAELENARIVADTTNKYHVINRATVQIRGRRFYQASGWYEYNVCPHEQEGELQNIVGQPVGKGAYSEKRTVTRATAEIEPEDEFFIDHKTRFRGTMSLNAESPSLKFDGFALVDAENLAEKTWFTVSFEGDKNDLVINYDVPKSYDGEPLYTGLYLSREFAQPYPRLFTPLMFRKDRQLFPVWKGVFRYDEDRDEFIFGDSTAVIANQEVGNRMVFRNRDRQVDFTGTFDLSSGLKYVNVAAAGVGQSRFPEPPPEQPEETEESEGGGNIMLADAPMTAEPEPTPEAPPSGPQFEPTTLDVMMGVNMMIPEPLLRIIENDFKSATFDSRLITYLTDIGFYRRAVQNLFPAGREVSDALDGLSLGFLDLPKRLNTFNLLFSRVPLRWEPDYQSFVAT
ncbi:MAG: hypothetical protein KDC54_18200, partial [Lewinella sp.]|nr:hypothetical protein [Lewinella sp.]